MRTYTTYALMPTHMPTCMHTHAHEHCTWKHVRSYVGSAVVSWGKLCSAVIVSLGSIPHCDVVRHTANAWSHVRRLVEMVLHSNLILRHVVALGLGFWLDVITHVPGACAVQMHAWVHWCPIVCKTCRTMCELHICIKHKQAALCTKKQLVLCWFWNILNSYA